MKKDGDRETDELFSCKMCGHCCQGNSTVSLSASEQNRVAEFLHISREKLLSTYCVIKGKRVEMKVIDGHCIFYGEDGLCAIHPVKPFHCRQWPLHPSILGDQAAWEAIKKDCPGFSDSATYEQVCRLIRSRSHGS